MNAIICDRCGKIIKINGTLKRDITIRIINPNTTNKKMSRGSIQDLCQDCYDDLKNWFYMKK